LLPAAVMFLTILAFNIMGDVLAKRFDVREAVA
jgi:ABC-type dipeptide/oligopeptide/nickel transport system permease subunit